MVRKNRSRKIHKYMQTQCLIQCSSWFYTDFQYQRFVKLLYSSSWHRISYHRPHQSKRLTMRMIRFGDFLCSYYFFAFFKSFVGHDSLTFTNHFFELTLFHGIAEKCCLYNVAFSFVRIRFFRWGYILVELALKFP